MSLKRWSNARIKNVPFNINAGVKVRLTEEAKLYLEKDLAKYGAKLTLDEEGYWNGPLRWMVNELGLLRSIGINPIIEIVFKEMDVKIPNEVIEVEIDNIRNAYDSEFKRYLNIISKYKVNIEHFEFLGKVCTYYGYTLDDLKEKLIKKEDMRRFIDE